MMTIDSLVSMCGFSRLIASYKLLLSTLGFFFFFFLCKDDFSPPLPPPPSPAGEMSDVRAVRKRQQLNNLVAMVTELARPGSTVVDFCSGTVGALVTQPRARFLHSPPNQFIARADEVALLIIPPVLLFHRVTSESCWLTRSQTAR